MLPDDGGHVVAGHEHGGADRHALEGPAVHDHRAGWAGPRSLIAPMVPGASVGPVVAGPHHRPYAPGPMQALAHVATLARLAALAAALALARARRPAGRWRSARRARVGPLPACRYDDILTTPRGYDDWSVTLVDTILRVPKTYVPPDLVGVVDPASRGAARSASVMAEDLKAMSDAAAAAGTPIGVQSPYRSYEEQQAVFAHWVEVQGYKRALQLSARPGTPSTSSASAIDVRSEPPVDRSRARGARPRRASGCATTPGSTASS